MRRNGKERGFSLIMITMSLVVMMGMLGLTFDLGRMFIVKNELQTYVDAAALAGAKQLNGQQSGIDAAHKVSQYGPNGTSSVTSNQMYFDTKAVNQVTLDPVTHLPTPSQLADTYSTTFGGTYSNTGPAKLPAPTATAS